MTFRCQDNTQLLCWKQMTAHENGSKMMFEYYNGAAGASASRFYQGRLRQNVDQKLNTFLRDKSLDDSAQKVTVEKIERAQSGTSSRRSALARALVGVMSKPNDESRSVQRLALSDGKKDRSRAKPSSVDMSKAEETPSVKQNSFSSKIPLKSSHSKDATMTQSNLKTCTVFGRFNKVREPFTEFEISKYQHAFNPSRYQAVTAKDAIIDPHQTMVLPQRPKDPGYVELDKRGSVRHDERSKVIIDYQGRAIYKIDSMHGIGNGNLWGQTTFSNLKGLDRPDGRSGFGYGQTTFHPSQTQHSNHVKNLTSAFEINKKRSSSKVQQDAPAVDEVDKELLRKKLFLIRQMLKNERRANQIIKDNMGDLAASMTVNNETVKRLSESLKASDRGVAAKF